MCDFCDGKIMLPLQNINNVQVTATVKHKSRNPSREYIYYMVIKEYKYCKKYVE